MRPGGVLPAGGAAETCSGRFCLKNKLLYPITQICSIKSFDCTGDFKMKKRVCCWRCFAFRLCRRRRGLSLRFDGNGMEFPFHSRSGAAPARFLFYEKGATAYVNPSLEVEGKDAYAVGYQPQNGYQNKAAKQSRTVIRKECPGGGRLSGRTGRLSYRAG